MIEGQKEKKVKALFFSINSQERQPTLKRVNMDIWKPYMHAVSDIAPQAMIVHDKFHLFKKLSEAIDKTRRKEVKENELLKKQKYTVLKNKENRTSKQQETFDKLLEHNLLTAKAWLVRENFINDLSVGRYFITGPQLSVGIRQNFVKSVSKLNELEINTLKPYFETTTNYKNLEFQSEFYIKYTYESSRWQQTGNLFNASVLYQKPDKAFGVEVKVINLLNNRYKIRFMNTEFLSAKHTTWLQPRIVMLNLHYKL